MLPAEIPKLVNSVLAREFMANRICEITAFGCQRVLENLERKAFHLVPQALAVTGRMLGCLLVDVDSIFVETRAVIDLLVIAQFFVELHVGVACLIDQRVFLPRRWPSRMRCGLIARFGYSTEKMIG